MTKSLELLEVKRQTHRTTGIEVLTQRYKWGWAMFYIDEVTGTLIVHSDWGDWMHSWSPDNFTEPTLKKFLLKADAHYITGKLTMGRKTDKYDADATEQAVLKQLESDGLSQDEIDELMSQWEFDLGPDVYLTSAPSKVYDWYDPADMLVYEELPSVTTLRERLVPALKDQLKELTI